MKDYTFPLRVGLVNNAIDEIKLKQRELIKSSEKDSKASLNKGYKDVFCLIGRVDNLRGLGLLDNGTYQLLVEENVRIEEKILLLIKEKKSTQPTANRVERTSK